MAVTLPDLETSPCAAARPTERSCGSSSTGPSAMNAWDKQLGVDLLAAVELAAGDDGVRAVTITGAGRAFSSGADLRAGFDPTPEGHPDVGTALRERYHPIITGVRRMPKPVLAAVNGPAVGIGCSLALACDLVLAAESAYFLLAFVNIGLAPDGGSSVFVPARAGAGRAAEMAMLGRARAGCTGARLGTGRPAGRRRLLRRRGRRARRAARDRARRAPTRPPSNSSTRASTRGSTSSSSSRRRCSSRWRDRRTSGRACWRSWRSARRGSPGE